MDDVDPGYRRLHHDVDVDQLVSMHWMYKHATWNANNNLILKENKKEHLPWLCSTHE